MKQYEIEKLIQLLSIPNEINLYLDLSISIKKDKVCLHDLGVFKTANIINIIEDKLSLQRLNIQKHNSFGLEALLNNLLLEKEQEIKQVEITNKICGYKLFFTLQINRLIGIYKNTEQNIEKDIKYQKDLVLLGHPNKDIYMLNDGKLLGNIFDLNIL